MVGPLPDGTLIEVKETDWPTLEKLSNIYIANEENKAHAIAAYNAIQEAGR